MNLRRLFFCLCFLSAFSLVSARGASQIESAPESFRPHLALLGDFSYKLPPVATSVVVGNQAFPFQEYATKDGQKIPGGMCELAFGAHLFPSEEAAHIQYQDLDKSWTNLYSACQKIPLGFGDEGVKFIRAGNDRVFNGYVLRRGTKTFGIFVVGKQVCGEETIAAITGCGSVALPHADLIAFLRKVKGGMLSPLNNVSDASIEKALCLPKNQGRAYRLGRLRILYQLYDAMCETPVPDLNSDGWVDVRKIGEYLDNKLNPLNADPQDSLLDFVTKLVPEVTSLVNYQKFFREAHEVFKLSRDAVLIPAIEESAYQTYRDARQNSPDIQLAFDTAIANNDYGRKINPDSLPLLRQKVEARFQYDQIRARRDEMIRNREENLRKIQADYRQDIDDIVYGAVDIQEGKTEP